MHLQDFLNGVCTHTIWVTEKRLTYYTGEYQQPTQPILPLVALSLLQHTLCC